MDTFTPSLSLPFLENWHAYNADALYLGASEYPLYSDAKVDGTLMLEFGPYSFSNTMLRKSTPGEARVPMVLRLALHTTGTAPDLSRTDAARYHGGDMPDEIAALVSLCMGIRMRAGPESRRFEFGEQYGHPGQWDSRATPTASGSSRLQMRRVGVTSAASVPLRAPCACRYASHARVRVAKFIR